MNPLRVALLGVAAVLLASTGSAQTLGPGMAVEVLTFGGPPVAAARQAAVQHPRPLAVVGGLAVGVWTRVPRPYDAAANLSAAANPLP
jgi:uncharacterized membrane protein YedE/YeeE